MLMQGLTRGLRRGISALLVCFVGEAAGKECSRRGYPVRVCGVAGAERAASAIAAYEGFSGFVGVET